MSLREAAEILGVHYMTAYRHVRTGRLPAVQVNGEWRIRRVDLDRPARAASDGSAPSRRALGATRRRLVGRLVAGDEAGAWALIEDALVGGLEPVGAHLELLAPAMHAVGDGWAAGTVSVDEEHRAAAVAHRLIGRLGPRFLRPGRKRGTVVLAGAPGDPHSLPIAMAADVLRAAHYAVVDLGAAVPPVDLARAASAADSLIAVGLCVAVTGNERAVAASMKAARKAAPGVPVLLGGAAVDADVARRLGADGSAADAADLVAQLDALRQARS